MSETTELTRTGAGGDGAIIRADKRGRARYDAAFRRRVVEAYARSGMSAMAFASHCGVKYPTLSAWVRKEQAAYQAHGTAGSPPSQGGTESRFLVAEVSAAQVPERGRVAALELEVAPGMVARAVDNEGVALLAALVRQLCQQGGGRSC